MAELAPCPCCGGPGQLKDVRNKIRQGWVGCPVCSLYISWKISPEGAIKKWNQRQPSRYAQLEIMKLLLSVGDDLSKLTKILTGGASPAPANKKEVSE